jgi:hypothetical protein
MGGKQRDDSNREDQHDADQPPTEPPDVDQPGADQPDAFDVWLTSCPQVDVPPGLRERCLATVPSAAAERAVAAPIATGGRQRGLFRYRTAAAVGLLATAAVLFVALVGGQGDSIFARALDSSQEAEVVYIVETRSDPQRNPGQTDSSQWLSYRGHGSRHVLRRNNEIQYVWVNHNGESTKWWPSEQRVAIQSNAGDVDVAPYFAAAAAELRDYEQMARAQGIPIRVEEISRRGTKVRQIRIEGFESDGSEEPGSISTVIVDIDIATNRIIHQSTRHQPLGENGNTPGRDDVTQIVNIQYPDADFVDVSQFAIRYPADAKVTLGTTAVLP